MLSSVLRLPRFTRPCDRPGLEIFLVEVAGQVSALEHEIDRLLLRVVHGDVAGRGDFGVMPLILLHGYELDSFRDGVIDGSHCGNFGVTCRQKNPKKQKKQAIIEMKIR